MLTKEEKKERISWTKIRKAKKLEKKIDKLHKEYDKLFDSMTRATYDKYELDEER